MKRFLLICSLVLTQWMLVTAQELLPYPIDTINGQAVYRYEVEKSIGLYRISVNFSVSQEDIIRWNPELKERGLHYGETIYIPVAGKTVAPVKHSVEPAVKVEKEPVEKAMKEQRQMVGQAEIKSNKVLEATRTEQKKAEAVTLPTIDPKPVVVEAEVGTANTDSLSAKNSLAKDSATTDSLAEKAEYHADLHIALLLPFQAGNTKRDQNMDRFVDFYEGVLLAVQQMQTQGLSFALDVYDTEKSDSRVRQLIQDGQLEGVDAILGLAYPMQLMQAGEWAKEKQVAVLAPFVDHIEGIESNPYILQFNPSRQQEAHAMADWLEQNKEQVNCVLIDAKDADIPQSIRYLRKEITTRGIPYTTTSIRNILSDSLQSALKDDVENILIFNTEKYSNIQVLMPRVLKAQGEHRITLYSKYSWGKENIPLPQIYTSIFTANQSDTAEYEQRFQHYFGHEHSTEMPRFDLLGYDLTCELVAYLRGTEYHGLQSDVRFERVSENGGWINTNIEIQRKNL